MNYVKRPKEEKVVLRMQQLYLKTERKLINEITRKRALGQVDYAEVAALERVQKILNDMQSEAFEYVPQMVETIFHGEGEKNAAGYANARTLTTAQIDVSQTLINNLLGEIVEASNTALESASTWLSIGRLEGDEFRNAALQFTAEQQAMGSSWQMAQKNMAVDLQARGITAFVDKAGRQWSLTDYCTMATRTTARQASVAANLTRDDHDLWQISRIGSTCPVCAVYEGRVYSKSGTNPDYPPLAAAFGKIDPYGPNDLTNTYLNIHPNCLHSLMKYTTIGKSDKEIQRDKDFSSFEKNPITHDPRTKKQIAAYREKERNRRRYIDDYKQWRKYKAAFGKDIPDFETFRAHKLNDDEKYKKWLHNFRSFRIKAAEGPYTIEKANSKLSDVLANNYNGNIERFSLNLVKSDAENTFAFADFEGISEQSAEAFEKTLGKLVAEYETPLNKVSVMGKEEGFFRKTIPASTSHNYQTATAEIEINPARVKDYDKYVESVEAAVKKGQFPDIKPEYFDRYVPTHEFAHTMVTMGDTLPGSATNWAKMNYGKIKKARKEINALYDEYKKELDDLGVEKKALYTKFFDGSITEKEAARLRAIEAAEKKIKISNYSLENVDEFWGEAFADAKLGKAPGKYSKKAEEIANKYFKKNKSAAQEVDISGNGSIIKLDLQTFAKIPEEKLTQYALNPAKDADKAMAFQKALGYTLENSVDLKNAIDEAFNKDLLVYKGKNPYGEKFEQIMEITGPNGKTANVCTGWIKKNGDDEFTLTSIYVKKRKKNG